MKWFLCSLASFLILFASSSGAVAQPMFGYTFHGPWRVEGEPGTLTQIDYEVLISSEGIVEGQPGVQGWSFSVSATGADIVGATTEGTVGSDVLDEPRYGLRNDGFEWTELVSGEGNEGAVSAVVLSYETAATLPAAGIPPKALALTLETEVPDGADDCTVLTLQFTDGLVGSSLPVNNGVTFGGETYSPSLESFRTMVCKRGPFQMRIVGDGANKVYTGAEEALLQPVVKLSTAVEGVQGWSLSVEYQGDCEIAGGTTDGTVGASVANNPPGLRDSGFEKTELAPPEKNAGRTGVVSAVVLSFTEPVYLLIGEYDILNLTVACDTSASVDGDEFRSRLFFPRNDGNPPENGRLTGTGQPVKTVVSFEGLTVDPGLQDLDLVLSVEEPRFADFVRCDPNGDGSNDLADAIWMLNDLFRGGVRTACRISMDCNNDNMGDISDAVYSLSFGFLGGPPPDAPYPECGTDDDITPENCPEGSTRCP